MTEPARAVFLSYASQDAEAARRICDALRAGGMEVWFDQSELRGGDAWDQKIRREVHDCALFIPVISANTASRHEGYFRLEWDLADQRTHMIARNRAFIVPVCLDATPDAGADVPESFLRVQWTRLPDGTTPPAFVERVSRLLSPEPAHAPTEAAAPRPSTPSPAASRRSKLLPLLIAAVVLVVGGYFPLDKFVLSKRSVATLPGESAPSAIPEKSIAVLPFVDMSQNKDQEYFSDGLSEELIDLLARISELRVSARTSSFYFKGKSEDIPAIAQRLRVANVLEGSVRKAGNTLRVTVQLIRADNGYHIWSNSYDRDLRDVFKVQDEIAEAVVAALKLKLAPGQQRRAGRTENTEAYNQYLLGREFFNRGNLDGFRRATDAYRKAIALDPSYAAAYAGLAYAESYVADEAGDPAGLERAAAAAERAVGLAPEEADGYAARGFVRFGFSWDWSGALADFEKALAIDAGSSLIERRYGELLEDLDRQPEAIAARRKAVELDPLSASAWLDLGISLTASQQFAAAHEAFRRALEINPDSPFALMGQGALALVEGNAPAALATYRQIDHPTPRLFGIAMAEHSLGHPKQSQLALEELIDKRGRQDPYQVASVYAWRGEKEKAFEWLERAYAQRDGGLSGIKYDPLFTSLRSDPRYKAFLRKMNLPV